MLATGCLASATLELYALHGLNSALPFVDERQMSPHWVFVDANKYEGLALARMHEGISNPEESLAGESGTQADQFDCRRTQR